MQTNLFDTTKLSSSNNQPLQQYNVGGCTVNEKEAPEGFIAISKNRANTPNVCASCDARSLCVANEKDWCLSNRCMSYEIEHDGKTYKRMDGQSVIFKRV